jgi:ribosomal protein S27AE
MLFVFGKPLERTHSTLREFGEQLLATDTDPESRVLVWGADKYKSLVVEMDKLAHRKRTCPKCKDSGFCSSRDTKDFREWQCPSCGHVWRKKIVADLTKWHT